jgi:leucyl aminopeptidase
VTPADVETLDRDLLDGARTDMVAVPVAPAVVGDVGPEPGPGTARAAALLGVDLAELAERAGATGEAGQVHVLHLPRAASTAVALPWDGLTRRVALVGVGTGTSAELRRAGAALAGVTGGLDRVVTTVSAPPAAASSDQTQAVRAFAEGYLLGAYPPLRLTGKDSSTPAGPLVMVGHDGTRVSSALAAARSQATATWLARDLTAMPASTKTPAWLADEARQLARAAGLDVEVLGARELARHGLGGIEAVGRGSANGPRLVRISWTPDQVASSRHVVVVGKGITFDTGGVSLKPRESMVTMKTDMAGAGVALATVLGAAELGVRHRVTAVLAIAENHLGAASWRPGDVVQVHGGTTIEVGNTDAEGRVVLADALAWSASVLDPDLMIDVATLTGAAKVGLGLGTGGLFTDDDTLAAALERAGAVCGEALWRLPLVADYEPYLRSDVADVCQIANDEKIGGGAVLAALLLRRFVGTTRWAHLDIAGPARSASAHDEVPEGATGFGVRLLLTLLADPTFTP